MIEIIARGDFFHALGQFAAQFFQREKVIKPERFVDGGIFDGPAIEAITDERFSHLAPALDLWRIGHGVGAKEQFGAEDQSAILRTKIGTVQTCVGVGCDLRGDLRGLGRCEHMARFEVKICVAKRGQKTKRAAEVRDDFTLCVHRAPRDPEQVCFRPIDEYALLRLRVEIDQP